jgi:hypothetical protein
MCPGSGFPNASPKALTQSLQILVLDAFLVSRFIIAAIKRSCVRFSCLVHDSRCLGNATLPAKLIDSLEVDSLVALAMEASHNCSGTIRHSIYVNMVVRILNNLLNLLSDRRQLVGSLCNRKLTVFVGSNSQPRSLLQVADITLLCIANYGFIVSRIGG